MNEVTALLSGHADALILLAALAAVLAVAATVVANLRRRLRRFESEAAAARLSMRRGPVREGEEQLEAMAAHGYGSATMRISAQQNLGWARIRRGRYEDAIQVLSKLEENPAWKNGKGGLAERNAWWLAWAWAHRGDITAAQRWLDVAEARKASPPPERFIVLALLGCRQGRYDDTARLVEEQRGQA